jgi:hypothetical protein
VMRAISHRTLRSFFDWMLNQRRGKAGRRLAGIKSANTLGTYWKVYRLVHERAMGEKIQGKMNRRVHKVRSVSCPDYRRLEADLCRSSGSWRRSTA